METSKFSGFRLFYYTEGRKGIVGEMTLGELEVGRRARVITVAGMDAAKRRLGALGVVPGAVIQVVRRLGAGLIVAIHDSRLAIDGSLTDIVEVEAL